MNGNECVYVKDDSFTRKTPDDWTDTHLVYEVTAAPRCMPLPRSFVHDETIQVFCLKGSIAFDVEDKNYALGEGDLLYIPSGSHYQFRCRQFEVSKLHIYAPSNSVEESWRQVAAALKHQPQRK
jgi:hypothetical protein